MIHIYGFKGCRACYNACQLCKLKKKEYKFEEICTDEQRSDLKYKAGIKGNVFVPLIFCDDTYLGGLRELKSWLKQTK